MLLIDFLVAVFVSHLLQIRYLQPVMDFCVNLFIFIGSPPSAWVNENNFTHLFLYIKRSCRGSLKK